MKAWRALAAYFATNDQRLAIAHVVVIAVVGNQPFYPLLVGWLAPPATIPAMTTWLSLPFFAAVPALGRRRASAAKLLLLGAAVGNTALCTLALGAHAGVELFYLPCLALALILFEPGPRVLVALVTLGVVAVLFATIGIVAPEWLSPAADQALTRLHAGSVLCLFVLIAVRRWTISRGSPG